jgi:glutathione S-transferase
VADLDGRCRFVLDVLEQRLAGQDWIAGRTATIADLALYPYTRLGDEIGHDPAARPSVARWLARIEALPHHLPVYADAAAEVVTFEDYFGSR